jgi:hypothetical protein
MTQWEYQTISLAQALGLTGNGALDVPTMQVWLNRLGAEGWELVSVFTTDSGGYSRFVNCVFKRPIIPTPPPPLPPGEK